MIDGRRNDVEGSAGGLMRYTAAAAVALTMRKRGETGECSCSAARDLYPGPLKSKAAVLPPPPRSVEVSFV
jgi:hypothetical protein